MPYLYLIGAVASVSCANVLIVFYNRKNEGRKNTAALNSLLYAAFAFLSWVVMLAIKPSFDWAVLPYSLGFGIFYLMGVSGLTLALKTGPIMLSSLFVQLSLIAVTGWGFFFWNDEFTPFVAIGLALVVVSLVLCLYKGKETETGVEGAQSKISWKWALYVALGFVGNAGCSIVQRTQQDAFHGQHGEMLMAFATLISALAFLAVYLRGDKTDFKVIVKESGAFSAGAGVCNALLNLFVILMAGTYLSPSLIYPVIAVGGLAVVTVFSLFVFKEKMAWWQWLGIAVGAAAVALLSI